MTPTNLITEGHQITAYTSSASGSWSTNAGTLWLDPVAVTPYAGQAVTTVYLKATNKTMGGTISRGVDTGSVSITGRYPGVPSYPHELHPDIRGLVSNVKRDGSINGRMLGDGLMKMEYKLVMQKNTIPEYKEVLEFWRHHYRGMSQFKYSDYVLSLNLLLLFTSRPRTTARSHNHIYYEIDAIEP